MYSAREMALSVSGQPMSVQIFLTAVYI